MTFALLLRQRKFNSIAIMKVSNSSRPYLFFSIAEVVMIKGSLFDTLLEILIVSTIWLMECYSEHGLVGHHGGSILVVPTIPIVVSPIITLKGRKRYFYLDLMGNRNIRCHVVHHSCLLLAQPFVFKAVL